MERRSQLPFAQCRKTSLSFQTGTNQCGVGPSKIPTWLAITNPVLLPASGARTDVGVFPSSQAQTTSRPTHSLLKGGLVPCWVHELALRAFTCSLIAPESHSSKIPTLETLGVCCDVVMINTKLSSHHADLYPCACLGNWHTAPGWAV